jgi:uncharacterized Tic20 family protein
MTSDPVFSQGQPGRRVQDGEVTSATTCYLGAIFLGPVIPLAVYVLRARRSPFLRYHVAKALNLSLTVTLYAACCLILGGLLLLDSTAAALIVVIPIGFVIWLIMLRYLLRGVGAASRDERFDVPEWICARFVRD